MKKTFLIGAFLLAFISTKAMSEVFALTNYDERLLENGSLEGYVMSEKFDGIRALWDGKTLKSRTDKAFGAPKCWTQHLPPFALDGELFIGRGKFEEVLSAVSKSECEAWQSVKYLIFDVPKASGTLMQRLSVLENYLATRQNADDKSAQPLVIIKQRQIHSKKELEKALKEVVNLGGEGLVVRKNSAPYESFRTKNALKLKNYEDNECKVIAHNAGKGKFEGKLGSITCEQVFVDKNAGAQIRRFKIGSGFTDKERANPPPLNSLITYKFNGYTKNGIPKFPVFLRIYTAQ